jgi:type VI secretion system secreted protein VgrG
MATNQYSQSNRKMSVSTPLGEDVLLLQNLTYREELGRPFEMTLEVQCTQGDIDFNKILGQSVTVSIDLPNGAIRYLNGIVRSFHQTVFSSSDGLYSYRAVVVPWISMLELSSNCQAYQNQTIPQIITAVFQSFNFSDYTLNLTWDYVPHPFCIQYRESAFNFVHRLLEFAGIFYYFVHENGSHQIMFCDSKANYLPFPGFETIEYNPQQSMLDGVINSWSLDGEVCTGSVVLNDYDYTAPRMNLMGTASNPQPYAQGAYQYFDYPGYYHSQNNPDQIATLRLNKQQCRQTTCRAGGPLVVVSAGYTFNLVGHPRQDQNQSYLTTSATLAITSPPYASAQVSSDNEETVFRTDFTVIPAVVLYASPVTTPKPVVHGIEVAVVVGPSGQATTQPYTNEYGCVNVQFFWDRYGQGNQNSSIPFRVSQISAGNTWGSMFIPRIGCEVIVSFLGGDPDRPIITGCLYNANNMPPLSLPTNSTVSYISDDGGNAILLYPVDGNQSVMIYCPYNKTQRVYGSNSPN